MKFSSSKVVLSPKVQPLQVPSPFRMSPPWQWLSLTMRWSLEPL
jgi:hypothetical protein